MDFKELAELALKEFYDYYEGLKPIKVYMTFEVDIRIVAVDSEGFEFCFFVELNEDGSGIRDIYERG